MTVELDGVGAGGVGMGTGVIAESTYGMVPLQFTFSTELLRVKIAWLAWNASYKPYDTFWISSSLEKLELPAKIDTLHYRPLPSSVIFAALLIVSDKIDEQSNREPSCATSLVKSR
jgi:hypothetical protein